MFYRNISLDAAWAVANVTVLDYVAHLVGGHRQAGAAHIQDVRHEQRQQHRFQGVHDGSLHHVQV